MSNVIIAINKSNHFENWMAINGYINSIQYDYLQFYFFYENYLITNKYKKPHYKNLHEKNDIQSMNILPAWNNLGFCPRIAIQMLPKHYYINIFNNCFSI